VKLVTLNAQLDELGTEFTGEDSGKAERHDGGRPTPVKGRHAEGRISFARAGRT
jgi:hypothetical protein